MAKTKKERHTEVHAEALRQFDLISANEKEGREQSLEDRRFYSISGAQWEGAIGEQFANRIQIEVNKVLLSVIRIFNEYRNNRVSAQFISKTGNEGDELADVCAGLYRADQQDSRAEEAYDNAFEEAVGGGFGAWRLCAEYEDEYDEDDDRQRIRFEPVFDADTCVYFDIDAKRQDKSDAKHCFVLTGMTRDAYIAEWGDDPATWPKTVESTEFNWQTSELVYVAEYYKVEDQTEKVYTYRAINGDFEKYRQSDFDADADLERRLNEIGSIPVSVKPVKKRAIHKYILSRGGVLEDCGIIAGTEIPVVPVFGKRWYVDGKERFMGHVRPAKDAQRLKNMQLSVLAETAAFSGVETPIFTPEQVQGHESTWANGAVNKPAYFLLNPITGQDGSEVPSGPIGYTKPPVVPQAMAALLEIAENDISDILGNQQGGEAIQSNISGRAVELIQSRLDMQSYIYMSNFAKAEKRSAEIWLSMARDLYSDDARTMKTIDEFDQPDFVDMGETTLSDGQPVPVYDMAKAKFDVTVDVGPTSATKRSAIVKALTQMLPLVADPQDQKVISAFALMNMEGEGIGAINDYFRRQMVSMGVIEPTDQEAEEMAAAAQSQQPSAQDQYLMAEASKSVAETDEARAKTEKAIADAQKARATAADTLAGIDRKDQEAAIAAMKEITEAGAQFRLNE